MEATFHESFIDQYASALPGDVERQAFYLTVQRLRKAPKQGVDLSEFLTNFAELVADLYAASAVAIWFQTPATQAVKRKVDFGWRNLALDEPCTSAHEQLISFAMNHPEPVTVHPFSAPVAGAGVSNPTDSFLLLAPARFHDKNAAVLEVALGPKPLRRPHATLVHSHLEWLMWLSELLQRGMEHCFEDSRQPLNSALACLQRTSSEVDVIQNRIRITIQSSLTSLAGQNFGSLAANQTVTKQVHALLESKGLRVKCPECGRAAILRCQKAGNSKTGAFMFDHYLDSGRTFHGGLSTFPALELVTKPPRRRSS